MESQKDLFENSETLSPSCICRCCKKPLKNPESIARGVGPFCAGCSGAMAEAPEEFDHELPPTDNGDIEIRRGTDGRVRASVLRSVIWHSPDGFEVGYGGSGPADLALNILQHFLPGREVECFKGTKCSSLAAKFHQNFKWHFLSTMDRAGGIIPKGMILAWIQNEKKKINEEIPA